ncbi:MAG: hypothetical protein D6748_04890 [Calditrichaeota bacterium]|nr:MAG: hypothetical protein D6748_04890 [Calditrichota bacterium]
MKSQYYLLISAFLTVFIPFINLSAGDGPTQPEAMQFEPVDVTDVVNLPTGDFIYALPLMEVPGTEGGYPLVLSYHAGIGPNQDATWVGLGWTLNPGAISRAVSGYPDDYDFGHVDTHYEASGYGKLLYLSAGLGPTGIDMSWDSNKGLVGSNAYLRIPLSKNGKTNLKLGYSINNGVNIGFSRSGMYGNNRITLGINYSKKSGVGFSAIGMQLDSEGNATGNNVSLSIRGIGGQTPPKGEARYIPVGSSWYVGASIPYLFNLVVGLSHYFWWLNESYPDKSYGYLHQSEYHANTSTLKKFERVRIKDYLYASQDVYQVTAQGIGGIMMPFMETAFTLKDDFDNDERGKLLSTWGSSSSNSNNEAIFKFLGELGANFSTDNQSDVWGDDYLNIFPGRVVSKTIEPLMDGSNNIEGFKITEIDGKIYEYKQPVINVYHFSNTLDEQNPEQKSYTFMASPYATNWLLTAVKGPDYVDRDGNGECNDGDWGYWIRFEYEVNQKAVIWRTPYTGRGPDPNSVTNTVLSWGIRDYVLLDRVETSSHIAIFHKSLANDRKNPVLLEEDAVLEPGAGVDGPYVYFTIRGDWEEEIRNAPVNTHLMYLKWLAPGGGELNIFRSDIIEPIYYNPNDGYTYFYQLPFTPEDYAWADSGWITRDFYLHNLVLGGDIYGKQLDRIDLYSKTDEFVTWDGNEWQIDEANATKIKSVEFTYNYLLCADSPNSNATDQAKLTLTSVQILGKNNISTLPAYTFEYANGDAIRTGLNPGWHEHDWDNWGLYRDPSGGNGLREHLTPQTSTGANKAAAWSLTSITTPTGGTIEIEYESDDYYRVSDTYDFKRTNTYSILNQQGTTTDIIEVSNLSSMDLEIGQEIYIQEHIEENDCIDENNCSGCWTDTETNLSSRTIISLNVGTNEITVNTPYTFEADVPGGTCNIGIFYEYLLLVPPKTVYGGGIRVKSITSSDGQKSYKTIYEYRDDLGFSTGVTPSLPDLYGKSSLPEGVYTAPDEYYQAYLSHELSYGRPSPGVIYSQVVVKNVNNTNNLINGKTVYEFHTANDYPYEISESGSELSFKNKSSIYGLPKRISYYEQLSSNSFRLIRQEDMIYGFSDALYNNGRILDEDDNDINLPDRKPLGLIQERYETSNEYQEGQTLTKKVDKQFINTYLIKSNSTEYYYENGTELIASIERNFLWDALSGQVIGNAINDSENKVRITKKTPAYWKYQGMEDKNMLTQLTQESSYQADIDINDITSLKNYSFPEQDILSSTITTWSDEWIVNGSPNNVWRKNDTYIYNKQIDEQDSYDFANFNPWSDNSVEKNFPQVTSTSPWKMTSNITQYTPFSYPVEEAFEDGTYSATLYGYSEALPVAIISNAREDECFVDDFESGDFSGMKIGWGTGGAGGVKEVTPEEAHTGQYAVKFSGMTGNDYAYINLQAPYITVVPGKAYTISAWYKCDPGRSARINWYDKTNGVSYPTTKQGTGQWELIEHTVTTPANCTQMQVWLYGQWGSPETDIYYDDIRVFPTDAQMNTYVYDNLTWKLIAITDANSVTTFYEYDDYGRLRLVRDDDQNILNKYEYNYKQ